MIYIQTDLFEGLECTNPKGMITCKKQLQVLAYTVEDKDISQIISYSIPVLMDKKVHGAWVSDEFKLKEEQLL